MRQMPKSGNTVNSMNECLPFENFQSSRLLCLGIHMFQKPTQEENFFFKNDNSSFLFKMRKQVLSKAPCDHLDCTSEWSLDLLWTSHAARSLSCHLLDPPQVPHAYLAELPWWWKGIQYFFLFTFNYFN